MVDNNIKRVNLFPDQLKKVDKDNYHHLRFRIVTEDYAKTSAWSPVYKVIGANLTSVSVSLATDGDLVTLSWGDANTRPEYDVFIKWGTSSSSYDANFSYHGTTPIHTYSFLKEAGKTHIQAVIQVATYNQEIPPNSTPGHTVEVARLAGTAL